MKPIDLVLSKLEGVKPQGNRAWMAKCPGHDDRQASLSVKEGDDGKVLLNCHANCDPRDVVAEMELGWEDLFPDRDQKGNDVVARYPYHDEAGKLLYEVVRLAPKSFRQRQPQPGGGWKWNMDGARRVLYHFPEILKAPKDRLVCIAEGEKDCDNLERIGMLATTNAGGAGKWRDDYTAALRGRGVAIFPDNDQPGVGHAATVAKALAGVAAWVKVVELPDLPEKGDVSDWIAAGGTREKLEKLVAAAPGKIPQTFKPSISRIVGERAGRIAAGKQVMTFGLPYLDQAMSGITRQDVILYGAGSGIGKTQLATITAMANAQRGKRVFYFALEAEDREIERRIKYQAIAEMYYSQGPRKPIRYQDWALGALESVVGRYEDEADAKMENTLANLKTFYREDSFTSADFQNQFRAIQDEADLVVLDHFHYVGSDNERDDELKAAGKLAKLIHKCAFGAHVPVVVVAHLRKKERTQDKLVPDLEDFSGCKDIGNVATKAVVIAPAYGLSSSDSHKWGTYVGVAKNRPEMSVCRYVALSMFDIRKNCYDREYKIGRIATGEKGKKSFKILEGPEIPFWADQDGQGQGDLRW